MIRVVKPDAPDVLFTKGVVATLALIELYESNPILYRSGELKFPEFDSGLYGHTSVKIALISAQHGKCAFCESRVTHIMYGDVEHFRPKRACQKASGKPLLPIGYYWLAYDWDNLLLACQLCNQRYKRNLFPLFVERVRCRTHAEDRSQERPMFIHPAEEDPEEYITFSGSSATPLRRSRRGLMTRKALGLNRSELLDHRQYKLGQLKERVETVAVLKSALAKLPGDPEIIAEIDKLEEALHIAQLPSAEYSSMAKAYLQQLC